MTTVVIPIFNAPEETSTCLRSVAAKTPKNTKVLLINDASDDPRIAALLQTIPDHWQLVDNEKNIGFVASANLGMTMAASDDIVLLNSDTEVTYGWLDELEKCLCSDDSIASVSPLTNNGELASIPVICKSNPYPSDLELWAESCRRATRQQSDPEWFDVPTTIGYCMLIKRASLDHIGYFDEVAFGRGYGEENDWCQRAIKAGWRHVICDRAFVAHRGGASFSPLGLSPGGVAMKALLEKYPNYARDVASFIETDPLAVRRMAISKYREQLREDQLGK